jgi:hypothetical protein
VQWQEKKEILQQKYLKPPCIKYTKMYTYKCRVLLAIDVDHYLNSFSCNGRKEDILQQKYLKPPLCRLVCHIFVYFIHGGFK